MITTQRFLHALARLLFLSLALSMSAPASEVHSTGGIGLKGYDPVAYFSGGAPARGLEGLRVEHDGAAYLFSTAENRDAFKSDPARYLPQYGGYCAFGVSRGYKADVDPTAFTVVEGKLYLNYNAAVQRDWLKDTAGFIRTADAKWPEVKATTRVLR